MRIQESGEMYLETILILSKEKSCVRSIDVCEYMGYSKPSISRAVSLLRNSGAVEVICRLAAPVAGLVGFPPEVVPMALLRPVSGNGSTALLVSVFEENGADSFAGRVASVLAGSSETTFYATAMYFGSVNVTKIRHTLLAAVAADLTAMVMSAVTVQLFFG